MAFSLDQVKAERKHKVKYVYTTELFGWSHGLDNISDNAKTTIRLYLDARLFIFGANGLTSEKYKYMIKDLLKKCCGKEFIDITPQDTDNNIVEIAFQLKWAIERHRKDKRTLYNKTLYKKQYKVNDMPYQQNLVKPPERLKNGELTDVGIENYFKDVRWL